MTTHVAAWADYGKWRNKIRGVRAFLSHVGCSMLIHLEDAEKTGETFEAVSTSTEVSERLAEDGDFQAESWARNIQKLDLKAEKHWTHPES